MTLTYAGYLRLDRLLDLQRPASSPPQHDETLFIIIHQVYELWFKQVLHEVDRLGEDLGAGNTFDSIHTLKRIRMIFKTLVAQVDILETMTPRSFSAFRERLDTASGFQSVQFRELEFALGYKRPESLRHLDPSWPGYERVERRLHEPSLYDRFYDYLAEHGAEIPAGLRNPDPPRPVEGHEAIQAALLERYRDDPAAAILFELMTDIDEGLQEWRYRHVKVVERTIGSKHGTGGSLGVEFLKRSLFVPIFPDLWAIRHEF